MGEDEHADLEEAETAHYRPRSDPELTGAFRVVVEQGPDAGFAIDVDADLAQPTLIGTSPVCGMRLADRAVSRRHASLDADGNLLRFRDLQSTNGSFIGGVRVVEALLVGGERIQLGATVISITRSGDHVAKARSADTSFGRFQGASPEIVRLYPFFERLAASGVSIVIEGETGTGKEVLAEALHEASPRRDGPYVVFDCTAVPANLIEAELFGHERGAFTGAVSARRGVFERADGGTLLIDEIGDLDVSLQSKLLRAIERGEVQPLGGAGPRRVDVRVIAATRRDLDRAVQDGRFRDDLFHRLAVARVELPPLRRRPSDIEMLMHHFWRELGGHASGPPSELFVRFHEHDWPGNVRELRNAVARYLALGQSELAVRVSSVPPEVGRGYLEGLLELGLPFPIARTQLLEEFQRRYVERVLDAHDGNVAHAAKASGVARRYFQILKGGGKRRR